MEQYELLWQYQQVDMELDQYEKEMRGNSNRKELLKHRDFLLEQQNVLKKIETDVEIMSDRMEALERQIRLNTLVTPAQVRYINDAIRKHARELLLKPELSDDAKAVKSLSASIRKSITTRYGVAALYEIPRHEYSVVMQQIDTWNDMLLMRDVIKAARKRREEEKP